MITDPATIFYAGFIMGIFVGFLIGIIVMLEWRRKYFRALRS